MTADEAKKSRPDFTPNAAPWMLPPLNEWTIVGMNHYHVNGERRLFVAMTKDGRCIQEEGPDDVYLWDRLWHKATANEKLVYLDKGDIESALARLRVDADKIRPICRELYDIINANGPPCSQSGSKGEDHD